MDQDQIDSSRVIAPPPLLYISAFLVGGAMHLLKPIYILSSLFAAWLIGGLFCLISAAFARWAFVTMRRVGTSASPYQPSEALTVDGPFRFSRNPIYVAMTGLYIGAAFLCNSLWPLVMLVPLLLLMYYGVVLREERYLSEKFGEAYTFYKAEVRRWL